MNDKFSDKRVRGLFLNIDCLLTLNRIFWQKLIENNNIQTSDKKWLVFKKYIFENEQDILTIEEGIKNFSIVVEKDDAYFFELEYYFPHKKIIRDNRMEISESTLKHFLKKSIRNYYKCPLSPNTIQAFHCISRILNSILDHSNRHASILFVKIIKEKYKEELQHKLINESDIERIINCYLELSFFVNYITIRKDYISINTTFFDTEYLISNLYGMPTDIPGFDTLFGEGGLILPESINLSKSDSLNLNENISQSRTVTIMGESGSGKTTLGLQLASEVAQKGGLAWYMPLEQDIQECLYVLSSFQPDFKNLYYVGKDINQTSAIFEEINDKNHHGALIFLYPQNDNLNVLFKTIQASASSFDKNKLNLFIIDSINCVEKEKGWDKLKTRNRTVKFINSIKESNKNILIIAEIYKKLNLDNDHNLFSFLENISDTHIDLTIKKDHNYAQRYIEIRKSRMQREQRGEHAFSINSRKGFHIYPSSASVGARIRNKLVYNIKSDENDGYSNIIKFGLFDIDSIINHSVFPKEMIVFKGPTGSYKTILGLCFLLTNENKKENVVSLWFDVNQITQSSKKSLISDSLAMLKNQRTPTNTLPEDNVIFYSLARGYINSGYILQVIEKCIQNTFASGKIVNKVLITGITHWQISSPFITEDKIFIVSLIELLRSFNISFVINCGENLNGNLIQGSILENANCVIEFERFQFRGTPRITMQIARTTGQNHDRNIFEIQRFGNRLHFESSSSLIRYGPEIGKTTSIQIRFFFHIESSMQKNYFDSIIKAIKSVVTPFAEIDIQDRLHQIKVFQSNKFSAMDELQIVQIDEFQLAMFNRLSSMSHNVLHLLPNEKFKDLKCLRENSNMKSGHGGIFAVPFIENIGLLVFENSCIDLKNDHEKLRNWQDICLLLKSKKLIFDFPLESDENYNCFYFEILLSFLIEDKDEQIKFLSNLNVCSLLSITNSDIGVEAAYYYRELTRVSYLKKNNIKEETTSTFSKTKKEATKADHSIMKVDTKASMWRHWFTTLNQMLYDKKTLANRITVLPLPGNVSIAGEWYLGIPSYSAATDVGIEFIKQLTEKQTELNRFRNGIGLPVRKSYYEKFADCEKSISNKFHMPTSTVKNLIENAFRRSTFKCYYEITAILASSLREIIEIDIDSKNKSAKDIKDETMSEIRKVFDRFSLEGEYVLTEFTNSNKNELLFNCPNCMKCKNEFSEYLKISP